jgi:16S rRNA processing protein RimM
MAAPGAAPRLEVGRIDKPHGLRGELVVSLSTNRTERLEPGSVLHTVDRVLTVESSRPNGHRYLVRFTGVRSREDADSLHGAVLTAEAIDDPDELWVHDLLGAEVVGVDGATLGVVESVLDNPASDLLVLASGALVPTIFVVEFDGSRVLIDPPAGLFDI